MDWKMKHKCWLIGLFLCLFIWIACVSFAEIDPMVDVGLIYNDPDITSVVVSASGGFHIQIGTQQLPVIMPDMVECRLMHYGVWIGSDFSSYQEAAAKAEEYDFETCLYFDGAWKIMTDMTDDVVFAGEQSILRAATLSEETAVVLSFSEDAVGLYAAGKPVIAYDTTKEIPYDETSHLVTAQNIPRTTITLVPRQGYFEVIGKSFRGSVLFRRMNEEHIHVVNRLLVDDYLYGVVPLEMSYSWPLEALKAQAVAARNYAIASKGRFANRGFDIDSTTYSQVYGGKSAEHPVSNQAVDQTKGEYLLAEGEVVHLYYHASSGGATDFSENIWGGVLPHIKAVPDPYSIGMPYDTWTDHIDAQHMMAHLEKREQSIGSLQRLVIDRRSVSGRVVSLTVVGNSGTYVATKSEVRSISGLKSTLFSFDMSTTEAMTPTGPPTVDTSFLTTYHFSMNPPVISSESGTASSVPPIIFKSNVAVNQSFHRLPAQEVALFEQGLVTVCGHGFGHGLGMSQLGAKAMAQLGKTYKEILDFYYKNTELVKGAQIH